MHSKERHTAHKHAISTNNNIEKKQRTGGEKTILLPLETRANYMYFFFFCLCQTDVRLHAAQIDKNKKKKRNENKQLIFRRSQFHNFTMLTATYMMGAMIESRDETNIFSPSLLFLRTDALETALTSSSIYSFWIQLKSTHLYAVSFSPVLPAHLSMATGCTLLKVKALFYFYSLLFFRCRSIARMADAFDFILFSFSLSRREFLFLLGFSWVVCMHFLNSLHVFLSLTSCVVLCDFYCSGRRRHHSHDLLLLFRNMRSV